MLFEFLLLYPFCSLSLLRPFVSLAPCPPPPPSLPVAFVRRLSGCSVSCCPCSRCPLCPCSRCTRCLLCRLPCLLFAFLLCLPVLLFLPLLLASYRNAIKILPIHSASVPPARVFSLNFPNRYDNIKLVLFFILLQFVFHDFVVTVVYWFDPQYVVLIKALDRAKRRQLQIIYHYWFDRFLAQGSHTLQIWDTLRRVFQLTSIINNYPWSGQIIPA